MDMNWYSGLSSTDRLEVLARRPDYLQILTSYDDLLVELISHIFGKCLGAGGEDEKRAKRVLNFFVYNLTSPAYLQTILKKLSNKEKESLLDVICNSPYTNPNFIKSLVSSKRVLVGYPVNKGRWLESAIWRRAVMLMEDCPKKKFRISELVPLGIEGYKVTSRAILASAYDESQLEDEEIGRLLQLFPNDDYFSRKLGKITKSFSNKSE